MPELVQFLAMGFDISLSARPGSIYVKAVDPVNLDAPGYINCAHRIGKPNNPQFAAKISPKCRSIDGVEERCAGSVDLDDNQDFRISQSNGSL
jgi:hypothetical protein